MAIQTFGSTLTDLQSGLNTAEGIDAQRYAAYLQARSEEQRTRAQREAALAKIIEDRNIRQQQGQQFDVNQRNLMDAARLEAQTREKVAEIQAKSRGVDPRFAQTISDITALNAENQQKAAYAAKLSAARKALVAQKNAPMTDAEDTFGWNNPAYKKRIADIDSALAQLDTQAALLELGRSADGGYIIPDFAPIQVPALLDPNFQFNLGTPTNAPVAAPVVPPVTANPAVPAPSLPVVTAPVVAPAASAPAQTFTYEVDRNGNFRAIPVPRPGNPALRPVFGDIGIIP